MRNVFTLLAFLAWAVVLSWLVLRAPGKWCYLVLVGFLSIALILGLIVGLSNSIHLFSPPSFTVASDESVRTSAQLVRVRELVSFCEGCHATDHNLPVARDSVSVSNDSSLVLMPSEIVDDSNVDGQELLAYVKNPAPDLEGIVSNWSETDFMRTIHTGKDPSGHNLAHGMSWQDIATFANDDDLRTYYLYLRGLTQIDQ
jgi:hypothetical protein